MSNANDRSSVFRTPERRSIVQGKFNFLSRLRLPSLRRRDSSVWDDLYDDGELSNRHSWLFTLMAACGVLLIFGGGCIYVGIWIAGAELRRVEGELHQTQQTAASARLSSDRNLQELNRIKQCINNPQQGAF